MLARLIIGSIALAATGYGVKKYVEENDREKVLEDTATSFFDWGDKIGQKIGDFGDSLFLGNEKDVKPKDVEEEFNVIHKGFYAEMIPHFLEVYEKLQNLPNSDMYSTYKLQLKVENNVLDIKDESKDELDKYVVKFSKGICAVCIELKEIKSLQKENCDFNHFSKTTKRKIEDTHVLMDELTKVYNLKVINEKGELEEEYKNKLDYVESIADKII